MHERQPVGLAYTFPLRPDFLAQLVIPRDLTPLEARRLAVFLAAIADGAEVATDDPQGQHLNPDK